MVGISLGPDEIIDRLGAGGMGEVYLGEGTRLGRKVAIKVLPAEFAADPERTQRGSLRVIVNWIEELKARVPGA